MPSHVLEVEVLNKVSNIGAIAEERTALASLASSPSLAAFGGVGGRAAGADDFEAKVKNAEAVTGKFGATTAELTNRMSALNSLGLTPANLALVGVVAGLGAADEIGNRMAQNAEKNAKANADLAQAYATLKEKVPTKEIDQFIDANARFLPSIYDTKEGFAQLARAGFDNRMQLSIMNEAVDLAAAKQIPLSQAVEVLTKAYNGQMRGLIDLGITTKEVAAAVGAHATQAQRNAELQEQLDQKLKNARKTTTELTQAQNEQNIAWQKFSNDYGPSVVSWQTNITKATTGALEKTQDFMDYLKNDSGPTFNSIDGAIVGLIKDFRELTSEIGNAYNAFVQWTGLGTSTPGAVPGIGSTGQGQRGFRAGRNI